MNDPVTQYLADTRDELLRMVNGHLICFEHDSEECVFELMREAADLLDEAVIYRSPGGPDGAGWRKMVMEDELARD